MLIGVTFIWVHWRKLDNSIHSHPHFLQSGVLHSNSSCKICPLARAVVAHAFRLSTGRQMSKLEAGFVYTVNSRPAVLLSETLSQTSNTKTTSYLKKICPLSPRVPVTSDLPSVSLWASLRHTGLTLGISCIGARATTPFIFLCLISDDTVCLMSDRLKPSNCLFSFFLETVNIIDWRNGLVNKGWS